MQKLEALTKTNEALRLELEGAHRRQLEELAQTRVIKKHTCLY